MSPHLDLVGLVEIAERLGVPRGTVDQWRHRGQLPKPDYIVSGSPIWEWRTVRNWYTARSRLSGAPSTRTHSRR